MGKGEGAAVIDRGPTSACLFALLLLLSGLSAGAPASPLAGHPSPYLERHADDPVMWRLWGAAVLDEARRSGRLILLSSGYFSCYWCSVMQRENYRDPAVAALINREFVPVLIDRELQPALDAYLVAFLKRVDGHAGWPLQVFLTPEGYPLAGTRYAPRAEFQASLEQLVNEWRRDPGWLATLARQASDGEVQTALGTPPSIEDDDDERLRGAFVHHALSLADERAGGFGRGTKFPSAPQLQVLLAAQARAPEARLGRFLALTLDRMAAGGLRDHLNGGFFRYTADADWREPHFEKMLYDNALLATLYLRAARVLQQPAYERVGRETLDFVLRAFAAKGGGLVTGLVATDAAGVEGAPYLWTEGELRAVLSPAEFGAVQREWSHLGAPRMAAGILPFSLSAVQAAAQRKLRAAGAATQPARDDKRLAGWNGLALSALAEGARLPQGDPYRVAGRRLRQALLRDFWNGKSLQRAVPAPPEGNAAALDDYAYLAQGLLDWSRVSGESEDRGPVGQLIRAAWARFFDPKTGWLTLADSGLPGVGAELAVPDGVMPSPSGVLIAVTLDWVKGSGDEALAEQARLALRIGRGRFEADAFVHATSIEAMARLP